MTIEDQEHEDSAELDATIPQIEQLSHAGRDEDVVRLCTELLERFPKTFELYYFRAQSRASLRDRTGAIDDLNSAIMYNPREPALFFFRGLWSIDVGDHALAVRDLQEAMELESRLESSYYLQSARLARAVALLSLGEFALSERECSELKPEMKSFVGGKLWTVAGVREHIANQRRP